MRYDPLLDMSNYNNIACMVNKFNHRISKDFEL